MQARNTKTSRLLLAALLSAFFGLQGCGGGGGGGSNTPTAAPEAAPVPQQTITTTGAPSEIPLTQPTTQFPSSVTELQPEAENATVTAPTQTNLAESLPAGSSAPTSPQSADNTGDNTQTQATTPADTHTPEAAAPEEIEEILIGFNPVGATAFVGQSHTFNVTASSAGSLSYQWRKNGRPINDAIMSHYTIDSLDLEDAGSYDVIVSNSTHSIQSTAASLTVSIDRKVYLSWLVPTKRLNGDTLPPEEIANYRIYHNTDDGLIETSYEVDSLNTEYEFSDLVSGTHHFTVTAIDTDGLESDLSEIVSKRVL